MHVPGANAFDDECETAVQIALPLEPVVSACQQRSGRGASRYGPAAELGRVHADARRPHGRSAARR
eukprot:6208916-Pleurochrysis_carterae.AAC.8